MSRSSTSNLAMALAGSGAPNSTAAIPATALYPSGIPPSLRNVKPSSFSTTTATSASAAAAAAATTKTQSMDIPKSRHGHGHGKPAVANVNIGGLPTPPNSVSPTLYPLSQERETYHRKAGAAALANTAAGVTAHDGELRHIGNEDAIEHENANVNVNANGSKHQLSSSPTSQRDIYSDLDLQEAVEHAHAQNQPLYHHRQQHQHHLHQQRLLSEITPESLAAYHIPEILLNEGPLAIRHIIARLNQKIPGFSRIPAARARRVVAAALEEGALEKNRQNQLKESMIKKAGSGHWDASSAAAAAAAASRGSAVDRIQLNVVSPGSSSSSFASSILTEHPQGRHVRSSSMTTMAESATTAFSYSETPEVSGLKDRCNAMSHEADKMSFGYGYDDISMDDDDDDDNRCDRDSVIGNDDDDDDLDMDWNEADDMTDEEDWAQIGADALRARSYGLSPPTHMMTTASGPDLRTMAMGINGQSGIVPLRAQQAIAQYQSASRNGLPNGNRRFNQHDTVPMATGRGSGGYSFGSGLGGSSSGAMALAKSMSARVTGPIPISMLKLKPEEKEQLAGSGPEERAAIEALLRLGSTPV